MSEKIKYVSLKQKGKIYTLHLLFSDAQTHSIKIKEGDSKKMGIKYIIPKIIKQSI